MPQLDRQAILDAVHDLPAEEQLDIARQILVAADTEQADQLRRAMAQLAAVQSWLKDMPPVPSDKRLPPSRLRGIANMDNPPDDATVERWMDEHRMEKYDG